MKKYQVPFQVLELDEEGEKPFLLCRYNKVGDRHRSPWTNKLYPKVEGEEPAALSEEQEAFRMFESKVNDVWAAYTNMYYGHEAVSSVYLVDKGMGAIQGIFGVHKKAPDGTWNSVSMVHVDEPQDKMCNYKVDTTTFLLMAPPAGDANKVDISAVVSKETSRACKISQAILAASHIENLGMLIEANEIDLRSSLERVQLPKMQEIMDNVLKQEPKMPTRVNPLMGMVMGSDLLKRKLAKG